MFGIFYDMDLFDLFIDDLDIHCWLCPLLIYRDLYILIMLWIYDADICITRW